MQSYGGNVTVNSDKTSGIHTRTVSGRGIGRAIQLTGNLAFGDVPIGTSSDRTLTIYNDGSGVLNVSGVSLPSRFSGNWSGSIPSGGQQGVTVTFSPMEDKLYSGNVSVTSDASGGTSIRSVSGTGTITLSLDSDGDGVCDAHEAIAGTENDNRNSYFHVAEVEPIPGGGCTLRWVSVAGRKYNILLATSLESGFSDLATGLVADPPENTYPDNVARDTAFYLIEVYIEEYMSISSMNRK